MNYKIKTMNYLRLGRGKVLLLLSLLFTAYSAVHAQVGINTNDPKATLHVDGDFIVTNTPMIERNASNLVVDQDGKVGVAVASPAQIMFLQSQNVYDFNKDEIADINNGVNVVVPWLYDPDATGTTDTNDIVTNNIMTFNPSENTFTFQHSGLYEITGYLNYVPYAAYPTLVTGVVTRGQYAVALNISVQYFDNSNNVWVDLGAGRSLWELSSVKFSQSVAVLSAVRYFTAGEKIRMVCKRPNSSFGLPHGTPKLDKPEGMAFTRGMKVLGL